MAKQQEFWETLKLKYEEKNRALQQREQELRNKLEVMDVIVGERTQRLKDNISIKPSTNKSVPTATSHTGTENVIISDHISANVSSVVPEPSIKLASPGMSPCPCQPPQEKGGLFKCVFSLFGSSKSKNTPQTSAANESIPSSSVVPQSVVSVPVELSPPAPQDIPTKESRLTSSVKGPEFSKGQRLAAGAASNDRPIIGYRPFKNENCMCNPCLLDQPPEGVANPEPVPQSVLQRVSGRKNKEGGCACSICSRSFSNVLPPGAKNEGCCCGYLEDVDEECICTEEEVRVTSLPLSTKPPILSVPTVQSFGAKSNKVDATVNNVTDAVICANKGDGSALPAGMAGLGSPSKLSLKSMDLFYMQNIQDLATQQKNLLSGIKDLEQKTKVYEDVFKECKNIDFSSKGKQSVSCPCTDSASQSDKKTNAELKLENLLLKNELKDMRLEVRQYLERMEGPMQFKIESERYKCFQLEQRLEEAAKELVELQEFYQREINNLKMQVCTANTNIYNLTAMNEQLMDTVQSFQNKCAKLEEDLIRQKISEAETIKSLQAALNAQANANVEKDECNLHQIARELSKVLKECEPCGECLTLPEDLTTAAKLLKSLTDMIENKLPKDDDAQQQSDKADQQQGGVSSAPDAKISFNVMDDNVKPADTLEILVVQELTGAAAIEQRASSVKPESQSITASQKEGQSQISAKPQSITTNQELAQASGEPGDVPSETQNVTSLQEASSRKSNMTEEKSEKSVKSTDEKSQKSALMDETLLNQTVVAEEKYQSVKKDSVAVTETRDPSLPKSKTSCKCVRSKKSAEVDQIWPKLDEPVVMKDSSVLETTAVPSTTSKKKCNCSVAKRLAQQQQQQQALAGILTSSSSSKKVCKCSRSVTQVEEPSQSAEDQPPSSEEQPLSIEEPQIEDEKALIPKDVKNLWPTTSERFRLSHQVTASRSQDLLKSETSVKCLKVKENFPFDIDTQVDVLNKAPDGVHVTTTITNSGTLEVITEGPEGVIETTLIYTNSGNVEVVTEILEFQSKGKPCNRNKIKTPADSRMPALEAPSETLALEAPAGDISAIEAPADAPLDETASPEAQAPVSEVSPADTIVSETAPLETTAAVFEGTSSVLPSSASEPVKSSPPIIGDAKIDAPKSGPIINPACKCRDCPVLELMGIKKSEEQPKTADETVLSDKLDSSPEAAVEPEKVDEAPLATDVAESVVSPENVVETTVPTEDVAESVPPAENVSESVTPTENVAESITPAENVETVAPVENSVSDSAAPAVNIATTATTQGTVADASAMEAKVVKTLSMTMHVENESDLPTLPAAADENKTE